MGIAYLGVRMKSNERSMRMVSVVGIPVLTAILVGIIAVDIKRQRKR